MVIRFKRWITFRQKNRIERRRRMIIRQGVLTIHQIRSLKSSGYLSKKGIKVANQVLKGKHDTTRYIKRRKAIIRNGLVPKLRF